MGTRLFDWCSESPESPDLTPHRRRVTPQSPRPTEGVLSGPCYPGYTTLTRVDLLGPIGRVDFQELH